MNTCTYEVQQDDDTVLIRITDLNKKEYLLKTTFRVPLAYWDPTMQRPKNIYLKRFKKINQSLDRLRIAVCSLLKESRTDSICINKLQRYIDRICRQRNITYPRDSFLYHIYAYIQSREHLICNTTLKRYLVFLKLLQRFEGYTCKNLLIKDINADFVKHFAHFGGNEKYSSSTIHRSIHFYRTVLNYLEKRGVRTFAYELDLPREKNNTPTSHCLKRKLPK